MRKAPARDRSTRALEFLRLAGVLSAGLIGVQVFVAAAAARTFPIPGERPIASVEIPDSWRPALAPDGVEGSASNGAVHLAVAFVAASDLDAATARAMERLGERGVVPAPETKRSAARRFNGLDALKVDFSGTDSNGESEITVILVAVPRKPGFVAICYWGDDEAQESVGNDLQSIADSIQAWK
jgi:hypothetical protein